MWDNIHLGKYYPVKSFVHSLNSTSKVLSTLLFVIMIFITNNIFVITILAILAVLSAYFSKVPPKQYLKSVWSLKILLLFIIIFDLLLFKLSLLRVIIMILRIILIVVYTSILTYTTSPNEITYGLEQAFKPLKSIKIPVSEMALTISLALRYIPTILNEASRIIKSQAARGIDFYNSNLKEKTKALGSMLIPVFILSLKRADDLSDAMELKLYGYFNSRTNYRMNNWSLKDTLVILLHILLFVFTIIEAVI